MFRNKRGLKCLRKVTVHHSWQGEALPPPAEPALRGKNGIWTQQQYGCHQGTPIKKICKGHTNAYLF